ncbi:MAG: EAL domain-containing protein [Oleibacter sp.]|nr:EAL domain-containing protein [Thalassolituus sp.]
MNSSIRSSVNSDIDEAVNSLQIGVHNHQEQLIQNAEVLTSDFGFKQAVAMADKATLSSMLSNHGQRINAELMFILDLSGNIVASSAYDMTWQINFPYETLLNTALIGESFSSFFVVDKKIYNIVFLPIKSPRVVAIAGIGSEVTESTARSLIRNSELEITFIRTADLFRDPIVFSRSSPVFVSTLADGEIFEATIAPENIQSLFRLPFQQGQQFASRYLDSSDFGTTEVSLFLTENLSPIYQRFEELVNNILIITFVLLVLTVLGSFTIARTYTEPLIRLLKTIKKVATGDYEDQFQFKAKSIEIDGLITGFRKMTSDLDQREKHIRYQSSHDLLTGLNSRDSFIQILNEKISDNEYFELIGINLTGFKQINDSLGMDIGDDCLRVVAKRLIEIAGDEHVSRQSADEFMLISTGQDTSENLAEMIFSALSQPMLFEDVTLTVGCRMGITSYPDRASDVHQLIRRVSIALEYSSAQNLLFYQYKDGDDQAHLKKLTILKDLREALRNDDGQLQMFYQPKMNLVTGNIEKAEALIRWFHPIEGFIPPDLFIDLAEKTGVISLVTNWVIRRVMADIKKLQSSGVYIQFSINMSAQDLSNEHIRKLLETCLEEHDISPTDICLEITERDMMVDVEKSLSLLSYYREIGFLLSIDDYGIGYSALSKLALMPVNELKIDKCFILNLASNKDDQIIVSSTIKMAHEMGLTVVAEGVEDQTSLDWLKNAGCDMIQGYYLARPMSLSSLIEWFEHLERPKKGLLRS